MTEHIMVHKSCEGVLLLQEGGDLGLIAEPLSTFTSLPFVLTSIVFYRHAQSLLLRRACLMWGVVGLASILHHATRDVAGTGTFDRLSVAVFNLAGLSRWCAAFTITARHRATRARSHDRMTQFVWWRDGVSSHPTNVSGGHLLHSHHLDSKERIFLHFPTLLALLAIVLCIVGTPKEQVRLNIVGAAVTAVYGQCAVTFLFREDALSTSMVMRYTVGCVLCFIGASCFLYDDWLAENSRCGEFRHAHALWHLFLASGNHHMFIFMYQVEHWKKAGEVKKDSEGDDSAGAESDSEEELQPLLPSWNNIK